MNLISRAYFAGKIFYSIEYEEDYLWLFLHLPKSFPREATKAFCDIFIPTSAIKAQPELDTFFS